MNLQHISWTTDGRLRYLDQTHLPQQELYREADTVDAVIEAVQALRVRGAPLIGIAAAMGLTGAAARLAEEELTRDWLRRAVDRLAATRPTAVNLSWAMARMREACDRALREGGGKEQLVSGLRAEAQRIWDEDAAMCRAIGEAGLPLIEERATVMTHCNAGALATGGIGTALAPVYVAHESNRQVAVISTETRPLRQGARLTAWELTRAGVPVTSIVDGAAAAVMAQGRVNLVITGADRIAANGDVANKIGTYGLAVLAWAHGIPFYVAAPYSTFDLSTATGSGIPIEQRGLEEIDTARGASALNPAFDVTPSQYVTALITDRGVIEPPYTETVPRIIRGERITGD
ncbi:MAG: S-methyl-5-thioribose-1-phosphate isomerase [Gemmatimonadota bacterium]|nr:MAG: S-methyl-5-thioribose-1-phosphate isomerase [Gemmatimonadota bacterium]